MRGNWKNSLFITLIILLGLAETSPAVELGKIQQRYAGLRDFTVSFKQETFQVIARKTVLFDGTLSYKRDVGVRMDVMAPERQIIVLKGASALIILPEQGTSQVQEVPKEIAAQNILGFFTGLSSIEDHYAVQKADNHLVLIPRGGNGSILVWVDSGNLIQRILLKDAMGNTSDIVLSAYRFNKGISDDLFRLDAPAAPGTAKGKPAGKS